MPGSADAKLRGRWTAEEDALLMQLVAEHGNKNWRFIATYLPGRLAKQCRERWFNQLDPTVRRESLSEAEWRLLLEAHSKYGNHWAEIVKSGLIPGRTANQLKNHWNTRVRRRMTDSSRHKRMRAAQSAAGKAGWPTSLQTEFNGSSTEFKGSMHDVDILGAHPGISSSPTAQPHHAARGKLAHTTMLPTPASSALPMPFGVSGRKNLLGLESLTEAASQHSLHEPTTNSNDERALGSSLPASSSSLTSSGFDLQSPLPWPSPNNLVNPHLPLGLNNQFKEFTPSALAHQQQLLLLQQQHQQHLQSLLQGSGLPPPPSSSHDYQQQLQYQQLWQLQQQQLFGYGLLPNVLPPVNPLLYPSSSSSSNLSSTLNGAPVPLPNNKTNPFPSASTQKLGHSTVAPNSSAHLPSSAPPPASPSSIFTSHRTISPSASTEAALGPSSTVAVGVVPTAASEALPGPSSAHDTTPM